MNKNMTTTCVDLGILLALVAISIGIWFYPWITLIVLGLVLLCGFLSSKPWKEPDLKTVETAAEARKDPAAGERRAFHP